MKQFRQAILWAVLAAILLLIILSAVGAIIGSNELRDVIARKFSEYPGLADLFGSEKPRELFNSWPLVIFWFVCLLLLATGFAAFRRLITAPAGLAMHLGAIFIIAGAMWGSGKAHEWRNALVENPTVQSGIRPLAEEIAEAIGGTRAANELRQEWFSPKVQSGTMPIMEGQGEKNIYNDVHDAIAALPFTVFLKDFSIDYYPPREKVWMLIVVAPVVDAQGRMTPCQERIEWKVDQGFQIPHTNVRAKVLQYIEHARPTFAEGAKPQLLMISDDAGKPLGQIEPKAGAEVALKEPPVTVRIVKVFLNLKIVGTGAGREVIDDVGRGENPGLQVRVSGKEGGIWEGYVLPQMPGQVQTSPEGSPLILQYSMPGPTGAAEDPSSQSPAMELQLTHEGRTVREWLLPVPGAGAAQLPLAPLMAGSAEAHGMGRMMAPELYLAQPRGAIQSYKSDVTILDEPPPKELPDGYVLAGVEGRRRAVIEVNHPLHWGGYSFYQSSYDAEREAYTVLSVVSDSGLMAVYLGMALLSIGAFYRFWVWAAWKWLSQSDPRETHGAK
jgi:hypothetical protein